MLDSGFRFGIMKDIINIDYDFMPINNNKFWQKALDKIKLEMSKENFDVWFKNITIDFDKSNAIIYVPNTFTKVWLKKKYHSLIKPIVKKISHGKVKKIFYQVKTNKVKIKYMSRLYQCDKCGKIIKSNGFDLSVTDDSNFLLDGRYNSFNFCEKCAKPLAKYFKKFLANKTTKKLSKK